MITPTRDIFVDHSGDEIGWVNQTHSMAHQVSARLVTVLFTVYVGAWERFQLPAPF